MSKQIIPLFFSSDDNYAPYMATTINSLIQNASKDYEYNIHILYANLSEEYMNRLKKLAKPGFNIIFNPMNEKMAEMTKNQDGKMMEEYYTLTVYFRLFIPSMFPEYDRGIYLDGDIVVEGDISELYNTDLKGNYIGACIDYSVRPIPQFVDYIEKAVGVKANTYVNSGVLLMDMKTLREKNFDKHFLHLLTTYKFDHVDPDQAYINCMLYNKIFFLDGTWNCMSLIPNNLKNPKLIHFNMFGKPWKYDNIQYDANFWHYAETSGFIEEIKSYKINYPDSKREVANKYAAGMIRRAGEIAVNGKRFSDVINAGKEPRI